VSSKQAAGCKFTARRFVVSVQQLALDRQRIFLPLALNMNQRPLPAAKDEVLDARKGQEFVRSVFGFHIEKCYNFYEMPVKGTEQFKENDMLQQITIQTPDAKRLKPLIKSAIRSQLADTERGIQRTRERLVVFEKQYNLSTAEFERRFHPGDLEETLDFIEWEGEIETLRLLEEKKSIIESAHIK